MVTAKKPASKPTAAKAALTTKPAATKTAAKPKAATKAVPKAAPKAAAKTATKATAKKPPKATAGNKVPQAQRAHYIEVAAFYIAERRGFTPGDPLQDWVAAEAEIDRLLAEGRLG
jgi:hypothetical protein